MFIEEWKDILGYEGLYQVSNIGRIKLLHFNKELLLKPCFDGRYYHITLFKNGKPKLYNIHRLVAKTFVPNPKNLPCVNHKNENKKDNRAGNLEWCTYKYNLNYGTSQKRRASKQCKPVICIETGKKYKSMVDAGKQMGIGYKHIGDCCKGKRNIANGYHWKYSIN